MSNSDPARIGLADSPPNQKAINAALELYVHGREWSKLSQTRSGWSVLRQATSPQMRSAMEFVQESHQLSDVQMHAAVALMHQPSSQAASRNRAFGDAE